MLKFLFYNQIPFTILACKVDKLPKSKIGAYVQKCASVLGVGKENIIPCSSETAYNRDRILDIINADLNVN